MTKRKFKKLRKEDRIDPFIRSLVGWNARPDERLLVKILESGKRGVPVSELSPSEVRLLPKLEKESQVKIIKDGLKVRLTELGATVARGARKMYPEFWE